MNRSLSLDPSSSQSDIFYVERSTEACSPAQNDTAVVLNSTELSGAHEWEVITISSVASLEPQFVTIQSDLNEPTRPYGYGRQQPILPPSLNDLNLPSKPYNVLTTMAVIKPEEENIVQSPEQFFEPSHPSPISTPPRNLSTLERWETPHTTTDDKAFYLEDEPRRIYWDNSSTSTFDSNEPRTISFTSSSSSTPPLPRRQKMKLSMSMYFLQSGGGWGRPWQHTCEACSQPLPVRRTP